MCVLVYISILNLNKIQSKRAKIGKTLSPRQLSGQTA